MPPLAPAKVSADVRFPDLGTEGKSVKRVSGSVVGLTSSGESYEPNDNLKSLWVLALNFCRGEGAVETVDPTGHRDLLELLLRTSCKYWYMSIVSTYNFTSTSIFKVQLSPLRLSEQFEGKIPSRRRFPYSDRLTANPNYVLFNGDQNQEQLSLGTYTEPYS